jgi:hypothetical protein
MALLNTLVKVASKPVPRTVSPRTHSRIDLITAGAFLAGAGLFWRRNKRVAVAALICGGADLAITLVTDYPGGVDRTIKFGAHHGIDLGLATMFATMPDFLGFADEPEKRFFLLQGAVTTLVAEITRFPEVEGAKEKNALRTEAA